MLKMSLFSCGVIGVSRAPFALIFLHHSRGTRPHRPSRPTHDAVCTQNSVPCPSTHHRGSHEPSESPMRNVPSLKTGLCALCSVREGTLDREFGIWIDTAGLGRLVILLLPIANNEQGGVAGARDCKTVRPAPYRKWKRTLRSKKHEKRSSREHLLPQCATAAPAAATESLLTHAHCCYALTAAKRSLLTHAYCCHTLTAATRSLLPHTHCYTLTVAVRFLPSHACRFTAHW